MCMLEIYVDSFFIQHIPSIGVLAGDGNLTPPLQSLMHTLPVHRADDTSMATNHWPEGSCQHAVIPEHSCRLSFICLSTFAIVMGRRYFGSGNWNGMYDRWTWLDVISIAHPFTDYHLSRASSRALCVRNLWSGL